MAYVGVAEVGTPASCSTFCKHVINPACMKAMAPPAGQRTACCSMDSGACPLVSHIAQVEVGLNYLCPSAGAPVTLRIVIRAASADTLLAWGMSASKTEMLPWP